MLFERLKARWNKEPRYSRRELLAAKPVRNPRIRWEDLDDKVILSVPRAGGTLMNWFVRKMGAPQTHRVELEAVGARVWRLCDGKSTVEGITKSLCQRYKMNRSEADASLAAFLQTLVRRGYIAIMVKKR